MAEKGVMYPGNPFLRNTKSNKFSLLCSQKVLAFCATLLARNGSPVHNSEKKGGNGHSEKNEGKFIKPKRRP